MKQFQLKPSLSLLVTTLFLYGFFIISLYLYFTQSWLTVLLLVLALLLMFREVQHYYQVDKRKPEYLSIDAFNQRIDHQTADIIRQYKSFNVYTNRWWLTLRLGQRIQNKNLVLLADCFQSKSDYLDFRYQLVQLNKGIHVT